MSKWQEEKKTGSGDKSEDGRKGSGDRHIGECQFAVIT